MPRLAFAGLGWIGRHRMNAIAEASIAEIAYTCDVDTELSYDDLLDSDAEATVIATPSAMHAEQAIAALEHGKAVFCHLTPQPSADGASRAALTLACQKTQTMQLTQPGDAWGGRAAVAWAEQLARSNRFDPEIEHVIDVAEALDSIYAGARA